jgi:hypothetical protein
MHYNVYETKALGGLFADSAFGIQTVYIKATTNGPGSRGIDGVNGCLPVCGLS